MDIQMDDIPYSLHQMVEIIGMKNFLKLCKMYGGYTLYILQSFKKFFIPIIDRKSTRLNSSHL